MAVRTSMPGRLGPYRLHDVIGEGGMGVVYLAHDQEGRPVAIKVLRPGVAADPDARRRLGREFETMRRVRSPFVAEVIDADVTGDMPYVVTRYVAGRTLDQMVRQDGPLRGQALERLAWGLAEGVAAVHDAGVVHRDLKPANVVISGGVPVLIDFGIAQPPDATRITQAGMFMGTPGYLAPEVVEGYPSAPSADVHSWGSTVAFAATGHPPFGTGPYESIFYRIISGQADTNGIPGPLLPLVSAALSREPASRPTAGQLSTACAGLDLPAAAGSPGRGGAAGPYGLAGANGVIGAGRQAVTLDAAGLGVAGVAGVANGAGGAALTPGTLIDQPAALLRARGEAPPGAVTLIPGPDGLRPDGLRPDGLQRQRTRQLSGTAGADDFADVLIPVSYAPLDPGPARPAHQDAGNPLPAEPAKAARSEASPRVSWLLSVVTMVIAVAASLLLPVAGTIVSLTVIVLLRAAGRTRTGLLKRRTGRAARASDVLVAIVTAPWALTRALLATLLLAPLALTAAAAAATVTLMVARIHPLAAVGGYAAGAFIAFYGLGPGSRPPRRQLACIYGAFTRTRPSAAIAAVLLIVAAVGTATVALSRPHLYWPVSASLAWHWETLRHLASTVQSAVPHL